MASIMRVTPEELRQLNLKLVIVGCGNPKMITGYRSKEFTNIWKKNYKLMLETQNSSVAARILSSAILRGPFTGTSG